MLISFESDFLETPGFIDKEVYAVEEILLSIANGDHAFYSSRNILNMVIALDISKRAKSVAKNLLQSYASEAGKYKDLDVKHLKITRTNTQITQNNNVTTMPLSYFFGKRLHRTKLHTENLIDGKILKHAALHYQLSALKRKLFEISCEFHGSGGSQTPVETEESLRNSNFALSITDSDFMNPNSSHSATTKKCKKLTDKYIGQHGHYTLNCRDVENLMHLDVLKEHAEQGALELIKTYEKNEPLWNSVRQYVDVKNGINAHDICHAKKMQGECNQKFWKQVVADLESAGWIFECSEDQISTCQKDKSHECNCVIFPKFGDGFSDKVLDYLDKVCSHNSHKRFQNNQDWLDAGRAVFNWCITDGLTRS